jgi:hypothetical protein
MYTMNMSMGGIKGQIKTPSILRLGEGRGAGICVSTYGSRGTTFIRRYVSVATLVCMDNGVVVVPLARLRGLPTRSTFDLVDFFLQHQGLFRGWFHVSFPPAAHSLDDTGAVTRPINAFVLFGCFFVLS